MKVPKCPACGHRGKPQGVTKEVFWCDYCGGLYDNEPEEGGDFYTDPSRRLELREEKSNRKASRVQRSEEK